jgi:hypothetical protein
MVDGGETLGVPAKSGRKDDPMAKNAVNGEYRLVQMNLRESTVMKVDELKELLGARTRTDAVRTAIELTYMITKEATDGKKDVVLETKADGSRERIVIPGLF